MNTKSSLELHYNRPFFLRSEIDRLLTLSMLFSLHHGAGEDPLYGKAALLFSWYGT